jgi:hypothetical protein
MNVQSCSIDELQKHQKFPHLAHFHVQTLRFRQAIAFAFLAILAFGTSPASATERITVGRLRVELERVVDRPSTSILSISSYMDTPGDDSGRLFFSEQFGGRIRVLNNGTFSTFLDLSSDIAGMFGARGLMSFSFHPGYADPLSPGYRKLYTFHTTAVSAAPVDFSSGGTAVHHNVVTEWQVNASNPNVVDTSTRREVFRHAHEDVEHSGGMLQFGPDGYLYGAIGTPTQTHLLTQAQNLAHMHGKYFRIDPLDPALTGSSTDPISTNGKYRVPADNPFVSTPGAIDEIFAKGGRNPYRFSIDPDSNLLFAGDVGNSAREEVSVVPAGGNMGWPHREGTVGGPVSGGTGPFTEPLVDYIHQGDNVIDGRTVVGGYVYRGSIPLLQGKYIFGEFSYGNAGFNNNTGRLLWFDPFDEMGNLKDPSDIRIEEMTRGQDSCSTGNYNSSGACTLDMALYSYGIDDDGELYAVGYRGQGGTTGVIVYKFTDAYFLPEGDYNEDGTVDDADYDVWKASFAEPNLGGSSGVPPPRLGYGADGNRDGIIDVADYLVWRKNYGASVNIGAGGSDNVPEPGTLIIGLVAVLTIGCASARCR